jgi:hypothetical protein
MEYGFKFIFLFKYWTQRILLFLCIIEFAFYPNLITICAIFYSIYGWFLVSTVTLKPTLFSKHPIPTCIVMGYGLFSFFLPILATLLEFKPVYFNMDIPLEVFTNGVLSVTMVVLILKLYVYVNSQINKPFFLRKTLFRYDFYKKPNDFQIWIIGGIGLVAFIITLISGTHIREDVSNSEKFLEGLTIFCYAPYFLFMKNMYSCRDDSTKKTTNTVIYVIYTVTIVFLALISNHRSTFLKIILGLSFVYFLGLLLGRFSYKIFTPKTLIRYFILLFLLTGPLLDLGIAMLTVRSKKKNVEPTELVGLTIDAYLDNESLNRTKELVEGKVVYNKLWSEYYLNNIFLARLCNLKAADINLFHAQRVKNNSRMRDYYIDKTLALLPSPALNFFNVDIDKGTIQKASYGDYIYYLSTGDSLGLESKRQSHLYGAGFATFGFGYLIILIPVLFCLFGVMELFVFEINHKKYFTIPLLILMPMMFTFFNYEGLYTFTNFILRGSIEKILLYILLFKFTMLLYNIAKSTKFINS